MYLEFDFFCFELTCQAMKKLQNIWNFETPKSGPIFNLATLKYQNFNIAHLSVECIVEQQQSQCKISH